MTKYIASITVTDPDTNLPVEIEIRKDDESGCMVGIDGAILDSDEDVYSPYTEGAILEIPDDETMGRNEIPDKSTKHSVWISWNDDKPHQYDFDTPQELNAFLKGIKERDDKGLEAGEAEFQFEQFDDENGYINKYPDQTRR